MSDADTSAEAVDFICTGTPLSTASFNVAVAMLRALAAERDALREWKNIVQASMLTDKEATVEAVLKLDDPLEACVRVTTLRERETQLATALRELIASGESYMAYHREKFSSSAVGITPALAKAAEALGVGQAAEDRSTTEG